MKAIFLKVALPISLIFSLHGQFLFASNKNTHRDLCKSSLGLVQSLHRNLQTRLTELSQKLSNLSPQRGKYTANYETPQNMAGFGHLKITISNETDVFSEIAGDIPILVSKKLIKQGFIYRYSSGFRDRIPELHYLGNSRWRYLEERHGEFWIEILFTLSARPRTFDRLVAGLESGAITVTYVEAIHAHQPKLIRSRPEDLQIFPFLKSN